MKTGHIAGKLIFLIAALGAAILGFAYVDMYMATREAPPSKQPAPSDGSETPEAKPEAAS